MSGLQGKLVLAVAAVVAVLGAAGCGVASSAGVFFFQAEDGIRDVAVTGVQTCALPIFRYARAGIFGAIILGLGRAVGETMAVTMMIGNKNSISVSLFDQGQTIASLIANSFGEASLGYLQSSALLELGLVLMLMSLVINVFARLMVSRVLRRGEGLG